MLSKKFKQKLKNIAVSTTLAISTVVVLFGMGANLDSIVNTIKELAKTNASEIKAESEAILKRDNTGYSLDITAKDDSGVRKIEVYQGSNKIDEQNFGGTDDIEYTNVHLNNIPFGQTQTVTVKVNGETIDSKEITNTRYISTAEDMAKFRDSVNAGNVYLGKYVELLNDITLSGKWTPIGSLTYKFQGTFDGNGYTISGLSINSTEFYQGLFSYIGTNGVVKKLTVRGSVVGAGATGGIVGWNYGRIELCSNFATVTQTGNSWRHGGITGANHGIVAKCINYGTITGYDTSGGIAGTNNGTIEECINKGNVTCLYSAGGIAGINGYTTSWTGAVNWGAGKIYNCYNTATIRHTSTSGDGNYHGGIAGLYGYNQAAAKSYVYNSYTRGTTTVVGKIYNGASTNCYTTNATVSGLNGGSYSNNSWVDDKYNINNGYPILRWQVECAELNARHEYMHVGDTKQLVLDTSMLPFENEYVTWHSYDESIARVDSNGVLTAVGEGYTTIWAEYSNQYDIKVMAIINVAKKGAVTYAQVHTSQYENNNEFTIVLKEDGTVWSAGDNTFGQLGIGTTTSSVEPKQVLISPNTPLTNVVKISSGLIHTLALTRDGDVYAWGGNKYGEIGNNSTSNQLYAQKITGLYDDNIVDIAGGFEHSMALSREGNVYTWGLNTYGELGNGTKVNNSVPNIAMLDNNIKVDASNWASFGLDQNGKVNAWGRGTTGRLGTGSESDLVYPTKVNKENIIDVKAGGAETLIRDTSGKIYATGYNHFGNLGTGNNTYLTTFMEIVLPSDVSINDIKQYSVGAENSILLLKNGSILTVGGNRLGQLSIGASSENSLSFVKALDKNGNQITNATNICENFGYGGNATTTYRQTLLYIDRDGYTYSVGANAKGQFGDGTTTNSNYYTKMGIDYLNYLGSDIVLNVGESFSINRNDFKVQEFNVAFDYEPKNAGNLTFSTEDSNITVSGNGKVTGVTEGFARVKVTDTDNNLDTYITVKVVNGKNMALEMGSKFSVGLTTYGEVHTWGDNTFGQLGLGNTIPYEDEPVKVTSLRNIKDIGAGNYHAVALDESGNVYTWGLNNVGQLGNNTNDGEKAPIKINGLNNIVKVDAYKNFTTALDSSGNLYAWGEGYDKVPKIILSNIIDIQDNVIITKDRRVRRLGDSVYINGIRNAVKVSGSDDRILVIEADGTVKEVNNSDNTVKTLSVADAVSVSTGNGFGYILNKSKDLFTYGTATNGEIGNGSNSAVSVPTKINDLSNIELVSCSEGTSGGVADFEGYMFTTGQNEYGQLGHSDVDPRNKFEIILNVGLEANVDKVVEAIGESEIVDIGLGINLNLKKDLEEDSTSEISIVDNTIANLSENGDETYTVTGRAIGRTFLNATVVGNIRGEQKQFATNVEVRIVPEGGITVPQIKSGSDFSVALKANGELEAWGKNNYGQLGIGNTQNYDEPQMLDKIEETIVEIAAGNSHVIALTEEGNIYGWGLNSSGQVGNGTTANQLTQATVINIYGNELSKIIRVEAHGDNSFAINEDGEVFAWGKDFGNKAKKLVGLENVIDVSTNYFVKADGTVYSYRFNNNEIETTKLTIVGKVRSMDEGYDHAVFLLAEGKIFAIGNNDYGQLGNGSTDVATNDVVAIRKDANNLFENAVAVEAGDRYTLILDSNGDVYTTGLNENGKLGIDKETTNVLTPIKNNKLSNVMLISVGDDHAVVALNNGTTYAWGKGTLGELGNRLIKDSVAPVMVGPYVVRENENHIVLGKTDEFVLKARCEYFNIIKEEKIPMTGISKNTQVARISNLSDDILTLDEQRLGYSAYKVEGIKEGTTNLVLTEGRTSSNGILQVEVLPVAGTSISPTVETNSNHTVTLKTNGTVWTYGNNTYGQLGIGNTNNSDEPRQVQFGEGVVIKQIAVGEFHSVALDTDGNVYTWGRNNYYQLGNSGSDSSVPVKVEGIPAVERITSGNNSVMAITKNNRIIAWGQNAYGELGTGTYSNRILPTEISGMHDVLDLQGGKNHYLILKTTGELYVVGSNLYNQLGIDLGERTRTSAFEKIDINSKFGSIAAKQSSNVAITVDGAPYIWGQNNLGNLNGTKENIIAPTQIQGLTGIVEADVGKTNTILRDYNNNIYVVGQNKYGQIGNGTTDDVYVYSVHPEIDDVLRVATGNTYTAVMKKDGTVWAWGDYNHGNRLLKSRTNSKVPVQIGSDTSSLDNLEIVIKKSEVKSVLANSEYQFNLIYEDENSTSNFTYQSLNTDIATINNDGNILGIREGTTWVKVTDTETGKVNVAIVRVIDNVEGYLVYTAPQVRTGENFVAVLKEDGNIDVWGYDESGMVDSDVPYTLNVVETYKKLDAGKNHIVALREDGTVWTAGDNSYGQLGIGNNVANQKLVQIQGLTDVEKIAAGDNFNVAMDSFGILYVWGEEIGTSPKVIDTSIRSASYLAAGGEDQIALVLPSGKVYGFGSILDGELDGIENAVKVEVGNDYLLILNTNGEVYTYKNGVLSKANTISNAIDISADGNTNMYQRVNEKVYVWGDNTQGQMGLGNTNNPSSPTLPVNNSENVFTIGAGDKNTYIVDIYGYVYSAGENSLGQIGNGTKEDTSASSYGRSLEHTIVGGRDFNIDPVEAIMEVNDVEDLNITGNTYNVFERQQEKNKSEFTYTSADSNIVEILTEEGEQTGSIKALAEGKTTIDITDKVTNETKTITRKVVPLDQNRIRLITADGNEAEAVTPSDESKYVFGYKVDVPMDDDQTLVTLNIITKDSTDSISIDEQDKEFTLGGNLEEQITFDELTKTIEVTVKTSNGTEFLYELVLNRVSNNNEIDRVLVNGYEARKSISEEDVYEIVVTDLGDNSVKVTANSEKAKVSIKGQIAEEHEQTLDVQLKDGYLEVPFKVTSESGKVRNAWIRIYTIDKLLTLQTITVNGDLAILEDGSYKAIIADDVQRSKIKAVTSGSDAYVGINDSEKELKETNKTVITTQDLTNAKIKLEKTAVVDGIEQLITKEYDLNIYKNKVFTKVQKVEVNGEELEEENNTFTAYVLSNVENAEIKITAKENTYTIKLGEDQANGNIIVNKDIPDEENNFTFIVDDGEEVKTYTIKVIRGNADTKIKKITVGNGNYIVEAEKTEDKIGDIEVYEARILDTYTNVDVTVQTANKNSKIDINNTGTFTPKIKVENIDLSSKTTLVPIAIKTQDEATTKDYYLKIVRQNNDFTLERVYVNEELIGPDIDGVIDNSDDTHYEIQLLNATDEIKLTGITTNENASISVNGEEAVVHEQSINLNISSSVTDVEIKVTSEAGKSKNYLVTIYTISDDTSLESVTVNGDTAIWNRTNNRYEIKVDRDLLGYEVTARTTNEDAKVKVDGTEAIHEVTKQVVNETEETLVNIVVTAANEITRETKKLAIIEKSNNKELGYVKVNGKSVSADENGDYNVEVVSSVKSVLIEVGSQDGNATINLEGDEMTGVWKNSKVLQIDDEVYDVFIIAEDGRTTSETFQINITRLDGNTGIDTLEVTYTKGGTDITKTPELREDGKYYLKLPKIDEERVSLRVILEQAISKVNILGNEATGNIYGYVNLTGDTTTIPIIVVAQDGTREEYTLILEKESKDTSIKEFIVQGETATENPVGYTITVDSKKDKINLRALPTHENAKIKFAEENDDSYVSMLDNVEVNIEGKDEILLQVLAEDNETTKIYIVNIVRTYDTSLDSITLNGNTVTLDNTINIVETTEDTAELIVNTTNSDAEIYITKDNVDIGAGVGTLTENIDIAEEEVYTYIIKVQGPDEYANYSKEYTLKVRKKSTNINANIWLDIDNNYLEYNTETEKYEAVVVGGNHTLGVERESIYSSVTIESEDTFMKQITINAGTTNVYTIKVIAEDGTEKEYKVQIYRKNNDTDIDKVKLKLEADGDAEELTALEDGNYYKKISRHQESVFVTLITKDSNAIAVIDTEEMLHEVTKEVTVDQDLEITNVTLKVIAEDGTEHVVTLKLEKESNDATLKELKYKGNVISQDENEEYLIEVDNRLTNIEIDAKPNHEFAKLRVKGTDTYLSTLDGENVDIEGKEYFEIEVKAEDNETVKTYKVNIRRIFNTEITKVEVDSNEVNPSGTNYNEFVSATADNHQIRITPSNELAIVEIYDNEDNLLHSGTGITSYTDSFEEESKTYKVKVKGPTGFEEFETEYSITLNKKSQDTSANIYVNNTLLTKDSETGKYRYITKVSNNTLKVETTNEYAKVSIGGKTDSIHIQEEIISINIGETKNVSVTVTSQNGESEEYEIEIVRLNNNANVTSIKVNNTSASKVTNEIYRSAQSKEVRNATVEIAAEYELAQVKAVVDEITYTDIGTLTFDTYLSGSGTKEVQITITAQDGTKNEITLNIVQNVTENMNFNVEVNNIEADKLDESSYRIFVESSSSSANVHIFAEDEFTTIDNGVLRGNDIEYTRTLNSSGDITLVTFSVTSELGNTNDYMLYIIKESNDYSIKNLYVNDLEVTKGENGRYVTYIENTAGNPTVKAITNSEYAYVRIGTNERELQESIKIVELSDNRTTTIPITTYSQSGIANTEYLDIITTFAVGNIDSIIIDDVEVTEYDEQTRTFTALVESGLAEHEIVVVADNNYVTLELEGYVGIGRVTAITSFEEEQEIKEMTLYVTGETDLTQEYTIVIVQKSSNVDLAQVKVNDVTLSQGNNYIYRKNVDLETKKVKVEVTAKYPYATIKVGDKEIKTGATGAEWIDIEVTQDEITIPVVVRAADGITIRTYNIILTRKASTISGKIITDNALDKHIAELYVYRTNDLREIDDELDPRELMYRGTSNEDGTYILELPYADNYDVVIKKLGYLTHTVTNITAEAFENVNVQTVKIRAGDVDDSSEIELDDLVEFNEHIGEVLNDSNKVFDLNEDGTIDVLDRKLIKANYHRKAIVERWINAENEEMILPLEEGYTITSEYGYRVDPFGSGETIFHSGIDMVGEHHEEVKAVLSGEVTYAGVQSGYGNCIEIKHIVDGEAIYSFYAHLSDIDVSEGEYITQGNTIGNQGGGTSDPNPGSSTGEHLHFELRSESGSGHSLNPHDYLEL